MFNMCTTCSDDSAQSRRELAAVFARDSDDGSEAISVGPIINWAKNHLPTIIDTVGQVLNGK